MPYYSGHYGHTKYEIRAEEIDKHIMQGYNALHKYIKQLSAKSYPAHTKKALVESLQAEIKEREYAIKAIMLDDFIENKIGPAELDWLHRHVSTKHYQLLIELRKEV